MYAMETPLFTNITIGDVVREERIVLPLNDTYVLCLERKNNVICRITYNLIDGSQHMTIYPFHMDAEFVFIQSTQSFNAIKRLSVDAAILIGENIPPICVANFLNPLIIPERV